MTWQPIETWNRRDMWVLLFQPSVTDRRYGPSERVVTPGHEGNRKTTHWMPLPPPPHEGD